MEWNSFYSNACYDCGNWGEGYPLSSCKKCRAVSFCHQDALHESPRHRELCEVLAESRGNSPSLFQGNWNQESWTLMKTNLMLIAQLKLGRKLNKQEEEVLKFPKRCVACFEVSSDKLTDCTICPSTSFCSNHLQTPAEHKERCKQMTECAASDVFYSPMLRTDIPGVPEDKCATKLPKNMSEFIKMCRPNLVPFPHNVQISASSEVFTRPLTLLYGAERLNLEINETLLVHVVGASAADLEDPSTFEILLHFRPNLKNLTVVFVGPDLEGIEVPDMTLYLCANCQTNQVKLRVEIKAMFYHDFFEENDFAKPDLSIGFNIGVHECLQMNSEGDTWTKSIGTLGELNCPFIVTSYTEEEARKDRERILKASGNFRAAFREKNPFRSLRHYRDFESDEFYYQNQFVMGFEGQAVEECLGRLRIGESMVCD